MDSFRHSSFGLAYRWRHPCRLAPRHQLLGSSVPTLGLTGLVLLYKRIPNGLLGFCSLSSDFPARHVHTWAFCVELPNEHTSLPCMCCLQLCFPKNDRDRHGLSFPWTGSGSSPFLGTWTYYPMETLTGLLLLLAHACASKSALLLTGGQFEPR